MTTLDLKSTAAIRARRGSARPHRWLAAPAAGLLIASLAVLAPGAADATTHGTLAVSPTSSSLPTLAGKRTNSRTVVNVVVPAALPFTAAVQLRSASTASGYRAKASVAADGTLKVGLSRVAAGTETVLGAAQATGLKVAAGETLRVQGAVAGTNPVRLYVRAWKKGAATPAWQLGALDYSSSRIASGGKTRLWGTAAAAVSVPFAKASTAKISVRKAASYKASAWAAPSNGAASTPPTSTTSGKPSASTTGVKAGTNLTRHDGTITVTTDGTVLANLDIHGFVIVRAKNVTISNCVVRGGKSTGVATGLITDYGYDGLLITDVLVSPEYPSVWFDGIKGSDFTARRVHVDGGVDSVKIHGNNVTIEDSLLENTDYFANDPQQNGGPTHNDNIQILYGTNLKITGNTIRGASNFAVLGGATRGNTNVVVQNNWLDGGHCTVKLQTLNGWSETAKVTGNKFGPNRLVSSCAFTSYPDVALTQSANTFELTGGAVTPLVLVS